MLKHLQKLIVESKNSTWDNIESKYINKDKIYDLIQTEFMGQDNYIEDLLYRRELWSNVLFFNDDLLHEWVDYYVEDLFFPLLNKSLYGKDEVSYNDVVDIIDNMFDNEISSEEYFDDSEVEIDKYGDVELPTDEVKEMVADYFAGISKTASDLRDYVEDFVDFFIWTRDEPPEEILDYLYDELLGDRPLMDAFWEMEQNTETINGVECTYGERAMRFRDFDDFVNSIRDEIGVYWSWEEGSSDVYVGDRMTGKLDIVVKAYLPLDGIDWENTVRVNLYEMSHEKEVTMKEDEELYIYQVEITSNKKPDIELTKLYDKLLTLYFPDKSDNYIKRMRNAVLKRYKQSSKDPWTPTDKAVLTFDNYITSKA